MREQSLGMCVVGTAYSGRLGGEDRNSIWRCFKAGGRQSGPGDLQLGRAKAAHVDMRLLSVSRWPGNNEESGAHCPTCTLLLGLPSDSGPFTTALQMRIGSLGLQSREIPTSSPSRPLLPGT